MKPINDRYFGDENGKLAIKFFDGTAVVYGSVVKQLGHKRFLVTDGTNEKIVMLAQNPLDIEALDLGTGDNADKRDSLGTVEILVGGSIENVYKLSYNNAITDTGRYTWELGTEAPVDGDLSAVGRLLV